MIIKNLFKMIRRSPEMGIITPEIITHASLAFLDHAEIPNISVGEVRWDSLRPRTFIPASPEAIESHNQAVRLKQARVVFQAPKPTTGRFKQTVSAVIMDVATLIIR